MTRHHPRGLGLQKEEMHSSPSKTRHLLPSFLPQSTSPFFSILIESVLIYFMFSNKTKLSYHRFSTISLYSLLPANPSFSQIKQAHARILVSGHATSVSLMGLFLSLLAATPSIPFDYSLSIYRSIENPQLFASNNMIRCFAKSKSPTRNSVLAIQDEIVVFQVSTGAGMLISTAVLIAFPESKTIMDEKLSEIASKLLTAYDSGELLSALEEGHSGWQKWVKNFGKSLKLKGKSLFMPLRVLLTGKLHGPDMGASVLLLHKAGTDGIVSPEAGFVTLSERFRILREVEWETNKQGPTSCRVCCCCYTKLTITS